MSPNSARSMALFGLPVFASHSFLRPSGIRWIKVYEISCQNSATFFVNPHLQDFILWPLHFALNRAMLRVHAPPANSKLMGFCFCVSAKGYALDTAKYLKSHSNERHRCWSQGLYRDRTENGSRATTNAAERRIMRCVPTTVLDCRVPGEFPASEPVGGIR